MGVARGRVELGDDVVVLRLPAVCPDLVLSRRVLVGRIQRVMDVELAAIKAAVES
jgi:hypothetical protein